MWQFRKIDRSKWINASERRQQTDTDESRDALEQKASDSRCLFLFAAVGWHCWRHLRVFYDGFTASHLRRCAEVSNLNLFLPNVTVNAGEAGSACGVWTTDLSFFFFYLLCYGRDDFFSLLLIYIVDVHVGLKRWSLFFYIITSCWAIIHHHSYNFPNSNPTTFPKHIYYTWKQNFHRTSWPHPEKQTKW